MLIKRDFNGDHDDVMQIWDSYLKNVTSYSYSYLPEKWLRYSYSSLKILKVTVIVTVTHFVTVTVQLQLQLFSYN